MARHDKRAHRAPATGGHSPRQTPPRPVGERRAGATAPLSAGEAQAVQALLDTVPGLAESLRAAAPEGRVSVAEQLAPVEAVPAPVQRAFAARLGDVRGPTARAAADVAHALGELASEREVAREARRARIRLRSAGALPTLDITSPRIRSLAPPELAQAVPSPAPQLVEAHATRARETGEVTLVLAWQEGADPEIVRGCVMTLNFWTAGVEELALTEPRRRSRFLQETAAALREDEQGELVPVSWAQARRLLLDALEVNAWRGTEPAADYRRHQGLIATRLLNVPDTDQARAAVAEEEARSQREGDRALLSPDLEPDEAVANWLGAWTFGDYGAAYDLLADDHPIHRAQTRDEYSAQRRRWADEAQPASLRLTLVREQAQRASALWVPGVAGTVAPGGRRELEAFWSITLKESPLGGAITELPMATLSSPETGRHWYWTAYTLERAAATGAWQITRSRDEGTASQTLTIEELQQRIQAARTVVEKTANLPAETSEEAAAETLQKVVGEVTAALHYGDALTVKLPLDEGIYRSAVNDAMAIGNAERGAALLERMRGRFPDQARTSFELGVASMLVATQTARQGQPAAEQAWLERSAAAMRQAAEQAPTAEHVQALGEVQARQGHYTQAVAHFREAIALDPARASAHADLADALMSEVTGANLDEHETDTAASEEAQTQRIQTAGRAALAELREAARHDPNLSGLYARMGAIYEVLHQHEDALLAFQEAVRHDPGDAEARYTLGTLYLARREPALALLELEQAAQLAPLSTAIRINLAACYVALERWRDAERELDAVDEIRPGLPQVAELRTQLARLRRK